MFYILTTVNLLFPTPVYKKFIQLNNKKTNNPIKKCTLLPRKHTNEMANRHKNMLNFVNYWGNANENYNEIHPETR